MLKSFLYKSEEYLIDYSFNDGSIITYRYIPSTARDGIWIHPFNSLYDLDNENGDVVKVRLRCSKPSVNSDFLEIQFENSSFLDSMVSE